MSLTLIPVTSSAFDVAWIISFPTGEYENSPPVQVVMRRGLTASYPVLDAI